MEGEKHFKVGYLVITLGLLFVGIMIGVMIATNTQKSQNVQTRASQEDVGSVEIISPAPGSKITSGEIKARFESKDEVKNLSSVYKIDDTPAQKLKIERLDLEKVLLTGTMDPGKVSGGRHTLSVYVYSNQGSSNRLIGSAVFYFQK